MSPFCHKWGWGYGGVLLGVNLKRSSTYQSTSIEALIYLYFLYRMAVPNLNPHIIFKINFFKSKISLYFKISFNMSLSNLILNLIKILIIIFVWIGALGKAHSQDVTGSSQLFAAVTLAADARLGTAAVTDLQVNRTRLVEINMSLLTNLDNSGYEYLRPGKPLIFNIFDDIVLTVVPKEFKNTELGFSWVGQIEGVENGQVVMVVSDGVASANITMPSGRFHIRFLQTGVYEVQQIDTSLYPPDHPPYVKLAPSNPAQDSRPTSNTTQLDDGSVIDVMVVYSPAARAAAGGTSAMLSLIDLAITETNMGYSNSGVLQRVRLVYSTEVAYTEAAHATPDAFAGALDCITNTGDGCLDQVHNLRDTYRADIVSFWIEDNAYCGMGWLFSNASTAFNVTARSCATGYYSFGHEMGHNMGARHDIYVDPSTSPYPHGHGFTNASAATPWRTIMAYNNACTAVGKNCTRQPYWSNPNVSFGGVPTGDASTANNRLVLNTTAYTVANFRTSISAATLPGPPSGVSATPGNSSASVSFTPGTLGSGSLIGYFAACTDGTNTQLSSGLQTSLIVSGLVNGRSYTCNALTRTSVGDSIWSSASNVVRPGTATAPNSVTANASSPLKAVISFALPSYAGSSPLTGYTATCTAAGQTTQTATGASSPITVKNLKPGVTYSCKVVANNIYGSGLESTTVQIKVRGVDLSAILSLLLDDN